jgi:hypothetical protein
VLSALPIVAAANVCCCLWVLVGGGVAAYLLQQNEPLPISAGDGALVGLIAGFIGAFVSLLLSIPITLLMSPVQQALFERLAQGRSLPPEFERYISDGAMSGIGIAIGFVIMLFVGPAFGTLGGLAGAALFRKSAPPTPPGTIDVPFTSQR